MIIQDGDRNIVTELNQVEDMPYQLLVSCVLKGKKSFTSCFRVKDWKPGTAEFWLEDECRHVTAEGIEGWMHSLVYEPKDVKS